MELSVNERLNKFLKGKDSKQKELANFLGLKEQQISAWLNFVDQIPEKHYVKIIRFYTDLDARWFITGEGEMKTIDLNIATGPDTGYKNNDCCKLCVEKDERIRELKDHILSLKSQIEAKKETTNEGNTQLSDDTKGSIAS
jgi:hypothetical protein